ncbi:septum formation protein [Rhodovulum imhoffii]|uniref:Nucleoside triphosphate pyrophosphatase n=1 Tax=Rhodovulum imhoffii TaxID=365340 RepID=A0A2T5BRL0_9RHOB|nr:Maf family protein [Rhodovulum imhoffii]MBK5934035.1 septum formation protein Maf [Rhodovulum imhoffii]PTN01920.1 septum formation protein [Rhodovulum imhoffii]
MSQPLVLASGSAVRARLLRAAGVSFDIHPIAIDEGAFRTGLEAENATPAEIAEALAAAKAARVAAKRPEALVIGADQVLTCRGRVFSKPDTKEDVRGQIRSLRGKSHQLLSAVVVHDDGAPLWRHVGSATLTMRSISDTYLDAYLDRNWPSVGESVGGYKLEEEGVRLFSGVEGDYFTVLGLPLLPLLTFLTTRGVLPA